MQSSVPRQCSSQATGGQSYSIFGYSASRRVRNLKHLLVEVGKRLAADDLDGVRLPRGALHRADHRRKAAAAASTWSLHPTMAKNTRGNPIP